MKANWSVLRRVVGSPRADLLLAVALAAYSQVEIWWSSVAVGTGDVVGAKAVLVPTALVATLALALRRRFPLATLTLVFAALLAQDRLTVAVEGMSTAGTFFIAMYSVAAHSDRRRALVGLGVALAAGLGLVEAAEDYPFDAVITVAPWLAGRAIRGGRLRAAELEDLTVELEREREERARLAVEAERARIARELHDLVAHSVGVMVVQTGGARGLLEPEQQRVREALQAVERTGREALTEMRRLLGVLRTDADAPLTPPPSLARVETLVDQVRGAGLAVEVSVEGEPRELAPGIELSAYRIVQEALTNALRHAGPAHVQLLIRYGATAVELVVEDDGRGPANGTGTGTGTGHGLVGMRERVALFGGELQAGAGEAGGFRVRAWLPFDRSPT